MKAIQQLNDLTYDICVWVDDVVHTWLDECPYEYTMLMDGAPPYRWLLTFKDTEASMIFKMTWMDKGGSNDY